MRIRCIDPAGEEHVLDLQPGSNVMDGAVAHGVPGLIGECGGFLACASCHVRVDDAWLDRVGTAEAVGVPAEAELLDESMAGREPGSRLSCQITVTPALEGLVVRVAPEQF